MAVVISTVFLPTRTSDEGQPGPLLPHRGILLTNFPYTRIIVDSVFLTTWALRLGEQTRFKVTYYEIIRRVGQRVPSKRGSARHDLGTEGENAGNVFTWQGLPYPPCPLPRSKTPSTPSLKHSHIMDFSQMNAAEQAQMTRILEKKQVCPCCIRPLLVRLQGPRCKTS